MWHEKAVFVVGTFKKSYAELVPILIEIEASREFADLKYSSLFDYVHRGLGLDEGIAGPLITVSRKARVVPELGRSLLRGEFTVFKAKSMVSVLTPENQAEWLERTRTLTTRELERAVAEERPDLARREVARAQGAGFTRFSCSLDEEARTALERAQELLASKKGKRLPLSEVIKHVATDFVRREDPVAKADRNARKTLHVERPCSTPSRTAKHAVNRRDRGACQFKMPDGRVCGAKLWVHHHHIQPKSRGGADTPENLITLCSSHHRLVHRH